MQNLVNDISLKKGSSKFCSIIIIKKFLFDENVISTQI